MATFVLIPGAGGVAWYWHRVVPLLEEATHEAIAVDLPGDDEQSGLSLYADRVVEAIGTRHVVLVAQSLGGFTAPLVCARVRVRMLVFVNAMIPVPGETAAEWWDNTRSVAARTAAASRGGYSATFDLATYFLHDVPPEVVKEGEAQQREHQWSEPRARERFKNGCRVGIR
jgi:pimeloyl-ACP methyl ester carboxylesterase